MPVVLVCTEPFVPLAQAAARQKGFGALPIVALPHPLGGRPPETIQDAAVSLAESLATALRTEPEPAPSEGAAPRWLDAPADPWEFLSFAEERGWGDGLPVLPPASDRIEALVRTVGRDAGESVGAMAPSNRDADIGSLAANAVMAGCEPAVFPVVVAAVEAMLAPQFNLEALQTTTHPVTPLIVVHGPAVGRLGFNAGANVLGQGSRSNAAVGRAVRLILQNVGGAVPGATDRATHGSPGKYSYCMAELPGGAPWEPLHAVRGLDPDSSAVTVVGGEAPHNVNDHGSADAEGLIGTIAGTLASPGSNNLYLGGQPLLVLSPEHADLLAAGGYSRAGVQAAIRSRATVGAEEISEGNLRRFRGIAPARFEPLSGDGRVPMLDRDEDLLVVVAGGPGKHSALVPTFGSTDAVTVEIGDGRT